MSASYKHVAVKKEQTAEYPRTWLDLVAKIPVGTIKSATPKQLAELVDKMRAQCETGHTSGYNDAEPQFTPQPAVGRPAELAGGKRVNVYLDALSLGRAAELGNGNVSEGIRMALIISLHSPAGRLY